VAELRVLPSDPLVAGRLVVQHHYLHRRPHIAHAYVLMDGADIVGVVTFGVPGSRHVQKSVAPLDPDLAIELNRLWVDDRMPRNTESWFVSRALRQLPPLIVSSYADTGQGHLGYVYRALGFTYAGWTDMDRRTPRFDYEVVPGEPVVDGLFDLGAAPVHTRSAFRRPGATVAALRRVPRSLKVRYWTTTGTRRDRKRLAPLCGWPSLDWHETPVPTATTDEAAA
jgi:hypothetical protein